MKEKFKIRLKEIIEEKNTNQDKFKNLRTLLEYVLKDILDYKETEVISLGELMGALKKQPKYHKRQISIGKSIRTLLNKATHEDKLEISDEELKELLNKYCEYLSKIWDTKIDAPQIPKPFPTKETSITLRKNFFLSKNLYGQKLTIRVENQGFYYDHDDVVNANKKRFSLGGSAYRSWSKYKYYTKTSGYPGWASDFIKKM